MSLGEAFPALAFRFFQTTLKKTPLPLIFLSIRVLLKDFFLCLVSPRSSSRKPLFSSFFFSRGASPKIPFAFLPYMLSTPRLKNCRETFSRIAAGFSRPPAKKESPFAQKDGACPSSVFLFVSVSLNGNFSSRTKIQPLRFASAIRRAPSRPPFSGGPVVFAKIRFAYFLYSGCFCSQASA